MEEQILKRIREYTEAVYQFDFKKLVDQYFYTPDLEQYYEHILWLVEHMKPFGESAGFYNLFPGITSIEEMKAMPMDQFIASFLSRGLQKLEKDKLKQMMESMEITNMQRSGDIVLVEYELENVFSEEGGRFASHLEVIEVEGEWYFKFRASMEDGMRVYKKRVEEFYEREKRDNLQLAKDTDHFEVFPMYGYRSIDSEQTILEPRFKDAGEFCHGLAYAQVFSKYGYINKFGKFVITPEFDKAGNFTEDGLAKVGQRNDDFEVYYGFINRDGKKIVPFTYTDANDFCDGMAAVKVHHKWGFINKEGKVVIEMAYDTVYDFEDGQTRLIKETEDTYKEFIVDRQGNVLESFENKY